MTDLLDFAADDDPTPVAPPARRVLTVSELTTGVRLLMETHYPALWVEGEISNARRWKTGHLYFTLKDSSAQLKAVMFRSAVRALRFTPEDGQHVIARGRVTVYEPKGEYQLVCEHMQPHGLGALQLAFEQLRRRLASEGLFDDGRKRPLPALPRKIGVVTSLEGAAIRDIIHVLQRRHPNVHVVISPVRVQGDDASATIVRGLRQIGRLPGVDVIIVTRGGGSVEDLWAFNEERVARAIAAAEVPVISAVGHETDVTISDLVADVRAPTPSAAAEIVVARTEEFRTRINHARGRLIAAVRDGVQRGRAAVHRLEARPGMAAWPARLAVRGRHVDELSHRLTRSARYVLGHRERTLHAWRLRLEALDLGRRLDGIRTRFTTVRAALHGAITEVRRSRHEQLKRAAARLEALSPLAVLGRGYAVCWTADRSEIVRDARSVSPGQEVRVTLHEGELECEVKRAE